MKESKVLAIPCTGSNSSTDISNNNGVVCRDRDDVDSSISISNDTTKVDGDNAKEELRNEQYNVNGVDADAEADADADVVVIDATVATVSSISTKSSKSKSTTKSMTSSKSLSYLIAQKLILVGLGGMYLVAFLGAYYQNEGLMGDHGIQPMKSSIDLLKMEQYNCHEIEFNSNVLFDFIIHNNQVDSSKRREKFTNNVRNCWNGFRKHPSIFWFYEYNDTHMHQLHLIGMTMSFLLIVGNLSRVTNTRQRRRHDSTATSAPSNSSSSKNMVLILLLIGVLAYTGTLLQVPIVKIGLFSLIFSRKSIIDQIVNLITLSLQGMTSMVLLFGLWISYFTTVTSANGTSFYQYGWESQLLETGFLAIFLCSNFWPRIISLQSSSSSSSQQQPSPIVLWLFRWLSYRISIGAGLIKIRGDSCWTQKTCLLYHFETQPLPSPISFLFHFLPSWVLQRAVDLDLIVQVYTSWFVLLPTKIPGCSSTVSWLSLTVVRLGGYIQIGFMCNIAMSGNLAMLNHLTILPSLACLDDACYPTFLQHYYLGGWCEHVDDDDDLLSTLRIPLPPNIQHELMITSTDSLSLPTPTSTQSTKEHHRRRYWKWNNLRLWIDLLLLIVILVLSRPVVENLLQLGNKQQSMNQSFDSFRLVNTYGAFGSVGKARYEPIVSIAYDNNKSKKNDDNASPLELEWIEIEFPCKPGSIYKRPCFCAPYHYRLDWNIWFIGFEPHQHYLNQRESWLYQFIVKILEEHDDDDDNEQDDNDSTSNSSSGRKHNNRPWLDLLDGTSIELLQQQRTGIQSSSRSSTSTSTSTTPSTPMYAKVDMYHYEMAYPLWTIISKYITNTINIIQKSKTNNDNNENKNQIIWWNRYYKENLIPVISYNQKQKQLFRV